MRVLLVIPQPNYPHATPCLELIPQGPAYIAGMLRAHGHEVRGVCTSYQISKDPAPILLNRSIRAAVEEFEPDVIALGAMAAEFMFLRDAIQFARVAAPHTPIVCGGSIMTNDRTAFELLKPDYAVMDEGEHPVVELLDALSRGTQPAHIENIAYWRHGEPVYNELRNANYSLDELPYPDYEPLDIRSYFELCNQTDNYFHVRMETRPRLLPISSGRSCPFQCTFCQYASVEGSRRKYRGRSMQSVVDEIIHFHELYRFNILKIYDDLFSVHEERILEFCELIRETKLGIHWNASMRVGDVTPKLLAAMKDAGCIHIGYGFESADDGVLKSMNKRITRQQITRAIELTEAAGIGIQANFIYGDPAETVESIAATESFYREECLHHIVHNDYVTPYPGSPIFAEARPGAIGTKRDYYETIHLRPRYNLTQLPEREFMAAVEPVVQAKLAGAAFARDVRLSTASRAAFPHPYFDAKDLVEVDAVCPHCSESVHYVFPLPRTDRSTWAGRAAAVVPIRYYCHHCHKRLLVSLLSLAGLEESFQGFVAQVNALAERGAPVVLAPTVRAEVIDSCMAHGMRFDELNVRAFLHRGGVFEHMTLRGSEVLELSPAQVARHRGFEFVVLPDAAADRVMEDLLRWGVAPERLHAPCVQPAPSSSGVAALQRVGMRLRALTQRAKHRYQGWRIGRLRRHSDGATTNGNGNGKADSARRWRLIGSAEPSKHVDP